MRRPSSLAGLLSLAVVLVGVVYGTWVAGGMDSYGYVSQSDRWLSGQLVVPEPDAAAVPWPNAIETVVPIGYVVAPDKTSSAPYYSPGLPLLMALARIVGGYCAIFWVVPISGGLLVAATFAIGRQVRNDTTGLAAAALVATSPALLFMSTSPMSDVPGAAFWALALAGTVGRGPLSLKRAGASGLAAGIAILIRPNLVPLAALIALYLLLRPRVDRTWRDNVQAALAFSLVVVPFCLFMAWIHTAWFGSPLKTGPGDLTAGLFSTANILPNLVLYPSWFIATQTPLALVGVAALFLPIDRLWQSRERAAVAVLFAAMTVVVVFLHCLYLPLDEWWYLRYLLAVWPAIFVGLALVLSLAWESGRPGLKLGALVVLASLCLFGLRMATTRGAFKNAPGERRFIEAAKLVAARTEPDAVILAYQHGGTVRYYAGRQTIRYEWIPSDWLERALAWLASQGRHAYVLLDDYEVDAFKQHFATQGAVGALDRRLVFVSRGAGPSVYFYDLTASHGDEPPAIPRRTENSCEHPAPTRGVPLSR
jgi:hypothetical protein